jgi:non-ribosomal peptide synthetase component F
MTELKLEQGTVEFAPGSVQATDDLVDQEVSYWRQKLAGIPAILELPTDHPRPPIQTFRAARESLLLSRSLKQALEALAEQEGVSLFVVLLAAFQTLLTRYTPQDDIVVGVTTRGREEDGAQELNQSFAGSIVIRTDLTGNPTFRQLLSRVSNDANNAREHLNVSWERVVEAVEPDRDASRHPLFQVLFSLEDSPFSPGSEEIWDHGKDSEVLKVDLQLQMQEQRDGLAAYFTYCSQLFEAATIVRMAGHFRKLLEGIVEKPDETVWSLPLLTDAERNRLVIEWNSTGMDYARDRCVHQLFEAQAARTPNATAVVFGNQSLTYGELERRAKSASEPLDLPRGDP